MRTHIFSNMAAADDPIHGQTRMMLRNLASMSGLSLFKAVVQFGISTLIALFVMPAEYGLFTFSLPIIQFIMLFTEMGLASAIVRQPDLTPEQSGGALSFSAAIGFLAAILLSLCAFPIQYWSGLPDLGFVLIALSLAVFFSVVAGVPRAILERALRYQNVATIESCGTLVAAVICTAAVLLGAGIWSLVLFHVVLQGLRAIGFLASSRHQIAINLHWRKITGLLSFGSWVLATTLLNFAARNVQNLMIGAYLGATAVGLYGLAYQFMILPLMTVAWPTGGVLLATLSNSPDAKTGGFQKPLLGVTLVTATIAFPLMAWIATSLEFPIHQLFAPSWSEIIPLLQLLAPLGAIQALAAYNGPILLARGYARLQLYVNLVSSLLLLAGLILALPHGLERFAEVYLIMGIIVALGQIGFKLWAGQIPVGDYLGALAPAFLATAAALGVISLIGLHPQSWPQWVASTAGFGIAVLAIYAIFFRRISTAIGMLTDARAKADHVPIDQTAASPSS